MRIIKAIRIAYS